MRRDCVLAAVLALGIAAAGNTPALAQNAPKPDEAGERHGPFVKTRTSLGDLLKQDFEIKGILGGALILVKDTSLYSCALVPDHEALTYRSQFECSVLDEITQHETP